MNSRSMVVQERLYFRNLPLSNWVEHEMLVEETNSGSLEQLAKGVSVFSTKTIGEQISTPHLLGHFKGDGGATFIGRVRTGILVVPRKSSTDFRIFSWRLFHRGRNLSRCHH